MLTRSVELVFKMSMCLDADDLFYLNVYTYSYTIISGTVLIVHLLLEGTVGPLRCLNLGTFQIPASTGPKQAALARSVGTPPSWSVLQPRL